MPSGTIAYNPASHGHDGALTRQFFLRSTNLYQASGVAAFSRNIAKSDRAMKLLFWLCFVLISYTYFGYAVWLWLSSDFAGC